MLNSWNTLAVGSTPLAPHEPIDRAHLGRMTLGDHQLESEVLGLFARQAGMLLDRMRQTDTAGIVAFAHTLDGSARGIGAWPVARAALAVQHAAAVRSDDLQPALAVLRAAVGEVLLVIDALARVH